MSTIGVPSKQTHPSAHPSGQVDSEVDGVIDHPDITTDSKSSLPAVPNASAVGQTNSSQTGGLRAGSAGAGASVRSDPHAPVQGDDQSEDHPSHLHLHQHHNGSTTTGGGTGHVPGHVHPSGIQVDVDVDVDGVEAEGTDRSHSHPHPHSQVELSDHVQGQVQVQPDDHVHHDGADGEGVGVGDHEPFDEMDAKAFWAALPIGDEHRPHPTTTIDELERLVSENAQVHVHVHPIHSHPEESDHHHHHHGHHHDVHHHHEHNEHDPYGPYSPAPDAPSAPESSLLQQQGSNSAAGSSSSGGQSGGQIRQGGMSANQMRQVSRSTGLRQTLPPGVAGGGGGGAGTGTGPDGGSSESLGGLGGQIRKLSESEPIGSTEGENSGGVGGVRRRTSNGVANVQNKKDNHKNVEKKRREKINAGIEALANYLPQVEKNKSTILQKAADYISHLKASETTNCEKWAMEKMMMDQAISDLKALVQAERHRRVDLEERVRLLEHELATEKDKVAASIGAADAGVGGTVGDSAGAGEVEGEDLSDRGLKRQRVDP
ncbi:helix-loop-helix dna-binding domain-containing protein [Phaffia rhodozyma]|uniref:Helix-loop-helix dna-binding domain-containing protein n=1 Tax=Phaffia rhodozyma TaxID=264483 RepID=A0A0F7SPX3_PHARH|nr:helix-loop-helix dna-binding domain-containing protein [Phaffia rhodozyma]